MSLFRLRGSPLRGNPFSESLQKTTICVSLFVFLLYFLNTFMGVLECVSTPPGNILKIWHLQAKWLSQQESPRNSVLGTGLKVQISLILTWNLGEFLEILNLGQNVNLNDADDDGDGGGGGGDDDVPTTLPSWQVPESITHRDQISRSGIPHSDQYASKTFLEADHCEGHRITWRHPYTGGKWEEIWL